MSKINAVRLVNINYNNNAIRISDETFHFNGKSTLLSLRNGGGKSVLVQMMTAPFVHKRYRDAKNRPFSGYFTTGRPSFILVEWALDQGAGYMTAGMMVRRSQEPGEDGAEGLETVNFISEYEGPCVQDISHLPIVEKKKREVSLKGFAACRQMFEAYKKEKPAKFFVYDMGNLSQSRQYFEKLQEYQVNYREWEGIIKKVNAKESGLSDLFADCRDERGLAEKWFLDAVEKKLDKDGSRMGGFQSILGKYVGQYKDNQSKIKKRDNIRLFWEEAAKIGERNKSLMEGERQVAEQENRIACFCRELEGLHQRASEEAEENEAKTLGVLQKMRRLEYEKLSGEYYKLEEEKRFHAGSRDMAGMEKEALERETRKIEEKLRLLRCARQQEIADGEKAEWERSRQQLAVAKERDADLGPERGCLGSLLKKHYAQAAEGTREEQEKNILAQRETEGKIRKGQETLADLEESLRENALRAGELKGRVAAYAEREAWFNRKHGEALTRNLLGEYEPGSLEIFQESCRKQLEGALREKSAKSREYEQAGREKAGLERSVAGQKEEKIRTAALRRQQEALKQEYDAQLEARRAILKYLDLDEGALFEEERIFQAADRKLREIEDVRRKLEREENELQKERRSLTEGRAIELPEGLEAEFESWGVHPVHGMEWLKKNGYPEEKNRELARRNPFLPYSLVLTEGEAEKLRQMRGSVPTSFPIPILLRSELGQGEEAGGASLLELPGARFYLLFNENLLDEEKLRQLVAEKSRRIEEKQGQIAIRKEEYGNYFSWKEQVKNQSVRKGRYQEAESRIAELEGRMEELDGGIRASSQELAALQERIVSLEKEIRSLEQRAEGLRQKEADLAELAEAYAEYQEGLRQQEKCRKEESRLTERKKIFAAQTEKWREELQSLKNGQAGLERLRERQEGQLALYLDHQEIPADGSLPMPEGARIPPLAREAAKELSERQKEGRPGGVFGRELLEKLEARYAAVTSGASRELRELERAEQKNGVRYRQAKEELEHLRAKYGFSDGAWRGVAYSRKEESDQEAYLADRRDKIREKDVLWREEDKRAALLGQQGAERLRRILEECGEDAPLPKEEIRSEDLEARRNGLEYQKQELEQEGRRLDGRLRSYGETLAALAEYSEFQVREDVAWEEDLSLLDARALREAKGILARDYNRLRESRRQAGERLAAQIGQTARMEAFQEDFYRKPLEAMLALASDGAQVQRQLETTEQSYRNLMGKLEVDISLVEKEKDKIVELLEDYLREVHESLGKIDQNSTISIRERPVKMLKIELPSWEENAGAYHLRLHGFLDELTQKGIGIFEKNENAQEYFGTQLTTKNLYDTVVGIGNVQIRLYKIEEQREYPITWAEVAKNSGGEGFLSAFVVLSSLLYFMRRDDLDIFADQNEGKVLLMDNPFAQTSAAHLLKPMMDMAEKTNTQLICLSGLGGESIYSRFDNIYVLNLVTASLRQGMQYLRPEHMRGHEPETVLASQIEVVEQQELAF